MARVILTELTYSEVREKLGSRKKFKKQFRFVKITRFWYFSHWKSVIIIDRLFKSISEYVSFIQLSFPYVMATILSPKKIFSTLKLFERKGLRPIIKTTVFFQVFLRGNK